MIHHWFAGTQPNLAALTYEPLEQPEEFSGWCPSPGFCCSFVPTLILIVGEVEVEVEVGVQLLKDGWSAGYKV